MAPRSAGPAMLPALLALAVLLPAVGAAPGGGARGLKGASNHRYAEGDRIEMFANKVGPYYNPSETYQYYSFAFCPPPSDKRVFKPEDLGEVLEGDRLVTTKYEIQFLVDIPEQELCQKDLSDADVAKFRKAVKEDYYYQMYFDDLPIWGLFGRPETTPGTKYYLYTHTHFDIAYNGDRVIGVNVSTDPNKAVDITSVGHVTLPFTYSVKWHQTELTFDRRLEKYSKYSVVPEHLEIHWFSIINSCVTVLLLTGFLATILMRVLKNDFMKYTKDDEMGDDQEESGWKYLHGDVFRFPRPLSLFCAMLGTGTQILVIAIFIFVLAVFDVFYPYNRGALLTACVVLYALTSGISGYVAASWYKTMGGTSWVPNIILTCALFLGPLLCLFSFLNTVAIAYGSTQALPFGTICVIIVIWALVTFPLTVIGGIAGKNSKSEFHAPCRTTKYPREIPPLPWYRQTLAQMAMAGFLPFSAIYIELYYIFSSIWGHKLYVIWSILSIVFVILVIVTAFITVALTYFQLAVEDHRWWWRSFLCGGSTGAFIFVYCFYFYFQRSTMSGFMQTSFFFGYMGVVCYAFFLMLGSVGFRASLMFVRHIYRAIKCE
ncbi:unnamed protein product [Ostreobium quekettii]|uniref:Transmembrane 9 superfamily member n=1 Tax=Ostreobium quekettii TaxID=121088 RepID=A0A8S1IZ11_9CHLO|nr:unnamed protein product [Ostreobium quekettii]|eukprot:evm.model.scf_1204EXC.2 EVM.evm.TU.scf_1204EXC.2   scf_1204EXC:10922-18350(-)